VGHRNRKSRTAALSGWMGPSYHPPVRPIHPVRGLSTRRFPRASKTLNWRVANHLEEEAMEDYYEEKYGG